MFTSGRGRARILLASAIVVMLGLGLASGVCLGGQAKPEGLEMPDKLPKLQGPVVVTTCGQSPGAMMVRMLCKQIGLACDQNDMLTASDLESASKSKDKAYKTLIITMGTSLKGMGAAGSRSTRRWRGSTSSSQQPVSSGYSSSEPKSKGHPGGRTSTTRSRTGQ